MVDSILGAIIVLLIGLLFGWLIAHGNVATECEKLGSFYVGDKVFYCEQVNK